jgi:hypothetical protein
VIRQSALSTEYVRYQVTATINGLPYNPTSDVVSFAFLPVGATPAGGSWVVGSWESYTQYGQAVYVARCLIGPSGGHALTKGDYIVWIQIVDSPEEPVRVIGNLTIT